MGEFFMHLILFALLCQIVGWLGMVIFYWMPKTIWLALTLVYDWIVFDRHAA